MENYLSHDHNYIAWGDSELERKLKETEEHSKQHFLSENRRRQLGRVAANIRFEQAERAKILAPLDFDLEDDSDTVGASLEELEGGDESENPRY